MLNSPVFRSFSFAKVLLADVRFPVLRPHFSHPPKKKSDTSCFVKEKAVHLHRKTNQNREKK